MKFKVGDMVKIKENYLSKKIFNKEDWKGVFQISGIKDYGWPIIIIHPKLGKCLFSESEVEHVVYKFKVGDIVSVNPKCSNYKSYKEVDRLSQKEYKITGSKYSTYNNQNIYVCSYPNDFGDNVLFLEDELILKSEEKKEVFYVMDLNSDYLSYNIYDTEEEAIEAAKKGIEEDDFYSILKLVKTVSSKVTKSVEVVVE